MVAVLSWCRGGTPRAPGPNRTRCGTADHLLPTDAALPGGQVPRGQPLNPWAVPANSRG